MGRSNAKLILARTMPEVLEQVSRIARRPKLQASGRMPVAISGQFSPAKDADYFTFAAKKGEVYSIEVFAQRIGSPADPDMEVFNVKGGVMANPQDDGEKTSANCGSLTRTQDLQYELTVPDDGD